MRDGMELIIHSQTSILQPLKSGNGIRSFIPDFAGQVIIHPCWDIGIMFVIKWAPEDHRRWLETVARLWDSVCMLTSSCKEGLLAFKWRSSFKLKTEKSREITFVVVVFRRHLRFSLFVITASIFVTSLWCLVPGLTPCLICDGNSFAKMM